MLQRAATAVLAAAGWRVRNDLPAGLDRFVLVAAPHTSNWDFVVALPLAAALGIDFYWVGKHTLFRKPFGRLMRRLGGIPVDRSRRHNLVEQLGEALRQADSMALTVAPEGTRSQSDYWRTGFYYIAGEAGVPIVPGYVDFGRKEGGLGPPIDSSLPLDEVMRRLRAFYDDVTARHPERYTPPRLRD